MRHDVKHEQNRWIFRRVLTRAASRAREPRHQVVERQHAINRNHQLPVKNEPRHSKSTKGASYLREVRRQQLRRFRVKLYPVSISDCETAKPVPFRFELPAIALR